MHAQGFDVLTWRKGPAEDIDPDLFADLTYIDQTGHSHQWRVVDTTVDLPTGDDDQVFTMRQVTLLVAGNKTSRDRDGRDSTRQINILTTRGDLPAEQSSTGWAHGGGRRTISATPGYTSTSTPTTPTPPPTTTRPLWSQPGQEESPQQLLAARARYDRALAAIDAALLDAVSPPQGESVLITNADHDRLTTDLRAAESNLDTAQAAHRAIPARRPLAQVNPSQQVLDVLTKLISHAIRITAFNTATALARDVRVHTGYARANDEAHSSA